MNFGTHFSLKPDVFWFRLLGFGVMVIDVYALPIHDQRGMKFGDILIKGLHPWN